MKRKKLKSIKSLRNKLDRLFSIYIRRRDGDSQGMGRCITCGKQAKLQAGHFVPRQHTATRWHPLNVHGQCAYCNCWKHGAPLEFYEAICALYGKDVADEIRRIGRTTVHYSRSDLESLIQKYSA